MTVCPPRRSSSARARSGPGSTPSSSRYRMLPMATERPSTRPVTPLPVTDANCCTGDSAMLPLARARHDRFSERMFADAFETRHQAQKCRLVERRSATRRHEARLAFGERARLVHHERRNLLEQLERFGISEQHAGLCAAPGAHHDRHRRREPERARARDDEHRNRIDERMRQPRLRPNERPRDERHDRATTTTVGTNHADTVSASRWIGARDRCASLTMRTICASSVSAPTRCASITKVPCH